MIVTETISAIMIVTSGRMVVTETLSALIIVIVTQLNTSVERF